MEETRKYFDYELAYEGYIRVKELLENGGIQAVIDNEEFDISCGGTIADWSCNGYIPIVAISDLYAEYDNLKNVLAEIE